MKATSSLRNSIVTRKHLSGANHVEGFEDGPLRAAEQVFQLHPLLCEISARGNFMPLPLGSL